MAQQSENDRPVVRVGTEGTYPPFSYRDPSTGDLTGYDIDVMRAVGEEAGFDVQFVTAPFDALFAALDAGRIDAIANQVTINPERQANYLFTEPYTYSRGVIVTATGTDDITSLKDLKGVTTAQSATSNWYQVARDAGAKVQTVEGLPQAAALVAQGRVDALVNDSIAVLDYLASTGTDEVKIAGDVGGEVGRQALVFGKDQAGAARPRRPGARGASRTTAPWPGSRRSTSVSTCRSTTSLVAATPSSRAPTVGAAPGTSCETRPGRRPWPW